MLEKLVFRHIDNNYNIFIIKIDVNNLIIDILVNDIKIIEIKKKNFIKNVKAKFTATFLIPDIGFISFNLDLKVI